MASTSQDIQTHEGGPGYKHWATELTLEKILAILKKQGVDPGQIASLLKSIDELNDNGKVDTKALSNVLANLKQNTNKTKERDKISEDTKKKEEGFWLRSTNLGKQAARSFKDANIKEHLKGAGDMFIMPVDSISDAFVKVAGVVGAFGKGIANAAKLAVEKLKIFSGKLGTAVKVAGGIIGWIAGGLTTVVGGLLGVIEQLGDSFFELYDTGINFSRGLSESESGLGALAMAAANARLTVGEFAEFIAENARVAVAIGAEAMGALSNTVRTALYPLGNLGLTASETNEHLGEYLDLQRTLGVLDNLTRAQQARASTNYLTNLTLLSQITGKRRKQIAQDMKQAMQNTALTAWMLQLDEKDRAQAMKNTEAITGVLAAINPEAADAFAEGLGKGSMMLTDYGKTMAAAGYATEMAAQDALIQQVIRGEITEEAATKEILRIQRMMKANSAGASQLHALAVAGHAGAAAATKHMAALEGSELEFEKLNAGMNKAEGAIGSWDEMQRAVSQTWTNFIAGLFADKDFSEGMNKMAAGLKKLLEPKGAFVTSIATFAKEAGPKLVSALGTLKDAMPDVITWMKKLPGTLKSLWTSLEGGIKFIRGIFMEEVGGGAPGRETEWVARDMNKVMNDMWESVKNKLVEGAKNLPWGKIAAAIALFFGGKALLGAVMGGITKKFMGGGSGVPGVPGAGGAENTMGGKLGKNVGGLIGGLGEGVMKGAAAGLAAFANPKILIGAGILGGAIAAIALGIGASAWILGKTVGPFAETLKKFENVDGDALEKTGSGMVALGKGLAYLGGGQVMKAIGNLFSGGGDPFAQVQKFSDQQFDEKQIEINANAMVAFEKAMGFLPTQIKKDSAVTAFGLIASIFGAGAVYPWDQVKVFADANLGESANLVANTDMPAIVPSTTAGGLFGWLEKAFVGDAVYPWTQVKTFADANLGGSDNLVANADKLKLFGGAMGDMPAIVPSTKEGGLFGWLAKAFVGDVTYPWTQVKTFADADLGEATSLVANADKLKLFGGAMGDMPALVPSTTTGGLFGWLEKAFVGDAVYPWDQVKKFSEAKLGNAAALETNAKAMKLFSGALTDFPSIDATKVGGAFGLMDKIFGTANTPWKQLKDFGDTVINATQVKLNAEALKAFADALVGFPDLPMTKIGGMLSGISGWVFGKDKMPWDVLKLFGEAEIPLQGVIANANALNMFSEAIAKLPTEIVEKLKGVGEGIRAMSHSVQMGSRASSQTTRPSRLGKKALVGPPVPDKAWQTVGDTIADLGIDADMLTSANNRETILGEIKVLLEELNVTTKNANSASERSTKKLTTAVAAANPYQGPS